MILNVSEQNYSIDFPRWSHIGSSPHMGAGALGTQEGMGTHHRSLMTRRCRKVEDDGSFNAVAAPRIAGRRFNFIDDLKGAPNLIL